MASSYLSSSQGLGALPNDFDLDSLPYIDGEVDLSYAQQLIVEEMRKFQPPKDNYLKKFPLPELRCLERLEMLRGQEAISKVGKPIEPKLNMERYQVQPPPQAMQNDVQAWKDAVSNAKSQVCTTIFIYCF